MTQPVAKGPPRAMVHGLIFLGILLLLFFGFVAFASFALQSDYVDTVLDTQPSPDGEYVATVYYREGGATAPDSTQVNLQRKYEGEFRANKGETIVVAGGRTKVTCVWKSNSELMLDYFAGGQAFQETAWKGITIHHDTELTRK